MKIRKPILIVLIYFSLFVSNAQSKNISENELNLLLIKSGASIHILILQKDIDRLIVQIYENDYKDYFPIKDDRLKSFKYEISSYFNSKDIKKEIWKIFQSEYNMRYHPDILNWLSSADGQLLVREELNSIKDENKVSIFLKEKFNMKWEEKRLPLFLRHNRLLKRVKLQTNIFLNLKMIISSTYLQTFTNIEKDNIPRYLKIIEKQRPKMEKLMFTTPLNRFYYTYRNIDINTLEKAIEFLESEPGRNFYFTLHRSFNDAIAEICKKISKQYERKR